MKKLILLIVLVSFQAVGQNKYLTKTGYLKFEASVPSFEEVKAENKAVTAILNTENGEFAALALVKGFRFKNALMEEHFNENYAESETYPKATFKGSIKNFSLSEVSDNKSWAITGDLTFHGKTKTLEEVAVQITQKGEQLILSGTFEVRSSDFNIDIPKIVRNKVSETVEVSFNFELSKK